MPPVVDMFLVVRERRLMGINVLALIVVDWMFSGVTIGRWGSLLFAGGDARRSRTCSSSHLVFFLALPLILLTFGIAYFFVNTIMLLFTEWVTPDFSIDGFWTYVGATIIVWLVNYLLGSVLGLKNWTERFAEPLRELDQQRTARDTVAGGDVDGLDATRERRVHRHLHLHRLERHERLTRPRPRLPARRDSDHGAGHRRGHRQVAAVTGARRGVVEIWRRGGCRGGEVQPPRLTPDAVGDTKRLRRSGGCSARNAVVVSSGRNVGVRDQPAKKREVRRHPGHFGLGERGGQRRERRVACRAVGDELRDHRVVRQPDLVSLSDPGVDADPRGQPQPLDAFPPAAGTFAGPPRRGAPRPHARRGPSGRRSVASGSPSAIRSCCSTRSRPVTSFGDGMLDLDPRVELQERELASATRNSAVPALR